jgi:hypothetical protein
MTYCFDIDGTLCTQTNGDYEGALPFSDRVDVVNELFHAGHTIKLYTARGSTTGIDWREFTARQLHSWGVFYHELIMGKPEADIYIDDRAWNAHQWTWRGDVSPRRSAPTESDGTLIDRPT